MDFSMFDDNGIFPKPLPPDYRAAPATLDNGEEIIKLYKIILNSKKVKEARSKFTLSENDFIYRFVSDDEIEIIRYISAKKTEKKTPEKQKITLLKTINNADIATLYKNDLKDFVENEIIRYFKLHLPLAFVMRMIFFCNLSAFKDKDYMNHWVDYYHLKTPDREEAYPLETPTDIEYFTFKIPGEIKYSFKSIGSTNFFDQMFELVRRYDQLQKTIEPKKRDKSKYDSLLTKENKKALAKTSLSARELSKKVKNFKKYFYGNGIT